MSDGNGGQIQEAQGDGTFKWVDPIDDQADRIEAKLDRILAILEKPKREVKERPFSTYLFDEWWKVWPNKCCKKGALAIWKRRNLDQLSATIITDTILRKSGQKWTDGFVEMPTTYLNGDRWTDEIVKAEAKAVKVPSDDKALIKFAELLLIAPKVGESMWDFRARVQRAVAGE